jgi:signal transduction histidine kinase
MTREVLVAHPRDEMGARYSCALQDYLASREEAELQRAYELGRAALTTGTSILDLAAMYLEGLSGVLRIERNADAAETVKRSAAFFVESLSPFEMTHRAFRDSAIALGNLNERLETEIKRIAHALHDEAGQLLASIYLALKDVDGEVTAVGSARLGHINELLGQVEVQLRRLSHELRPTALGDLGLVPALQFLAEGVSMRYGLTASVDGTTGEHLPVLVETAVYRIVQEALTNVAKHAAATRVDIRLWNDGPMVRCIIRDDGVGFDVAAALARRGPARGFGLAGIQERVAALRGTLRIESRRGAGTRLDLSIPATTERSSDRDVS